MPELLLRRQKDLHLHEVPGDELGQLLIQDREGHDEDQDAAGLQQVEATAREHFFMSLTAAGWLVACARPVGQEVAIGWVQEQEAKAAVGDPHLMHVGMRHGAQDLLGMPSPLFVQLNAKALNVGTGLLQAVHDLSQRSAFAATGVDHADRTWCSIEC